MVKTKTRKQTKKQIRFFSKLIQKNFSMSEELAKAIGTVVVQALTENAKSEDLNIEDDLDIDLEDENLEESSRDAGNVSPAEGPKAAPDLSEDFNELKNSVSNHSYTRYELVKDFLNFSERIH